MNTAQLECFLTVADTLNFARAAEELNITQPAVTQQIQSLETELGTKLFNRTTRSVELTKDGMIFSGDAKNIMLIAERAKKKFARPEEEDWQFFNVGTHSACEILLLKEIFASLKDEYPKFRPNFSVVPFWHLFKLLEQGDEDLIMAFKEKDQKNAGIKYSELTRISMGAALPSSHPLAQKNSLNKKDLSEDPLILIYPQKCPDEMARLNHLIMEDRSPSSLYFCESLESALTLAGAGYGTAILPDFFPWKEPDIKIVPIEGLPLMSYGAYYKNAKDNPLVKSFLERAKKLWAKKEQA